MKLQPQHRSQLRFKLPKTHEILLCIVYMKNIQISRVRLRGRQRGGGRMENFPIEQISNFQSVDYLLILSISQISWCRMEILSN